MPLVQLTGRHGRQALPSLARRPHHHAARIAACAAARCPLAARFFLWPRPTNPSPHPPHPSPPIHIKGIRKEFDVNGLTVLVFWYRNQLYAIESRSPAEGAYAEGFIKAKFTQDYAIECPSTGSLFSLKDGSVVSWYPGNPVLRMLTPANTCRKLEIYPVKIGSDAVYVDTSIARAGTRARTDRGGAGGSLWPSRGGGAGRGSAFTAAARLRATTKPTARSA
jgi:nitrite reductase/ring-hydroxylating ferredoxin subunit